eukprot:scaffold9913_cov36-Cyclotella_meneghiniana.AAC.12
MNASMNTHGMNNYYQRLMPDIKAVSTVAFKYHDVLLLCSCIAHYIFKLDSEYNSGAFPL